MYKFVELIYPINFEVLSNLVIYTYKAFKVRDGELFLTDNSAQFYINYYQVFRRKNLVMKK